MYLGEFVSNLNWGLSLIKARLLLSLSRTALPLRRWPRATYLPFGASGRCLFSFHSRCDLVLIAMRYI
jgi:hypothetical protein